MRLALPLRLAAALAVFLLAACGGNNSNETVDTMSAAGAAGTMPMDTAMTGTGAMGTDTMRRDTMATPPRP